MPSTTSVPRSTGREPRDAFVTRHVGPDAADVAEMLRTLGLPSLEALVDETVPRDIRARRPLDLPAPRSEHDLLRDLRAIAAKNRPWRSFLGLGYSGCVTPPVVQRNVLENPGWYTQYTPYQSEIAQGRLEALLAYQTMVVDLTGMEIANASLLDEATAAAEAMHLCFAARPDARTFLVARDCHPQTIAVVRTRAKPLGIRVVVGDPESFGFDAKVAGCLLQYPATDGAVVDPRPVIERAHAAGALVAVASDLLALCLLTPPGELGADVVVGSSQRFGVPMGFGGPHAAFFATREAHKRQMPGRLVGLSKDAHGNPALRLALGTREQHIRRERATSNICTAQVLLAVMAAFFAVWHGPDGLRRVARRVRSFAHLLDQGLRRLGLPTGERPFFDTVRVDLGPERRRRVLRAAAAKRVNLRSIGTSTVCVALDQVTSREDVEDLLEVFAGGPPGFSLDDLEPARDYEEPFARRSDFLTHPVFASHRSETELLRYVRRLEAKDLSLTTSMIPLGSCTMKLNATTEMIPVTWPELSSIHPFAPASQTRGYQELFERLEKDLCEITGFAACSLQPNAGSQGEYAGLLVIREHHARRGEGRRDVCLIPTSAHGTNPASAVMAGMRVVTVACDERGNVDLDDLRAKVAQHRESLSALMITYPSTHGVFEPAIREICDVVHEAGGQVYMDGANMNAQVGLCRPGDFGPDVCHLNLHKTFCAAAGTPVALGDGVARRVEEVAAGQRVLAWSAEEKGVRAADVEASFRTGRKLCVEVTLQDGRSITCTDDHRVLTTEGWVEAGRLDSARHRVVVGPETPLDDPANDVAAERRFVARYGDLDLSLTTLSARTRTLAFFRLLGAACADGTHAADKATGRTVVRLYFGTRLDAGRAVDDVALLTGVRPTVSTTRTVFGVRLPAPLVRAFEAVSGFGDPGPRVTSTRTLPDVINDSSTPKAVVREFLGGLFGGDGAAPLIVHLDRAPHTMKEVRFCQSRVDLATIQRLLGEVCAALARLGIDAEPTRTTRPSARAGYGAGSQRGTERWTGSVTVIDGLAFAERVGFRYCSHKATRLSAAAAWWRMKRTMKAQRRWVAQRALESVGAAPRRSGPRAVWGPAVASARRELSAAQPVLSAHYAGFEGHARVQKCNLLATVERPATGSLGLPRLRRTHRRTTVRAVRGADGAGLPRLEDFLTSIGARPWFNRHTRRGSPYSVTYATPQDATVDPTMHLAVVAVRAAGERDVYDLTVAGLHSFLANGVVVHNCIPHGGGGPGMGPICVAAHLAPYLPGHPVVRTGGGKAIGPVSAAPWGSAGILPIPWAYIRLMGAEGLAHATKVAILNANYMAARLEPHFPVLYKGTTGRVAHEFILDLRPAKEASGIEVEDVAKRLIDYGFHAPTVSFPVPGTLMIEPTESEPKAELDRLCDALIAIRAEIDAVAQGRMDRRDNPLKNAPHTAAAVTATEWTHPYSREEAAFPAPWTREHKFWPAVARVDNVYGDRNLVCACPPVEAYAPA